MLAAPAVPLQVDVQEIVRRSVAATQADWKAAPAYNFEERDLDQKLNSGGAVKSSTSETFQVLMIDGSDYHKMLARDGEPLSAEERRAEDQKLGEERYRRLHESPDERAKRIQSYQKGREQDHLMMKEMIKAFEFRLLGEQRVDGHNCWELGATPKPGYVPPNRDTKVLTGMRGTLWIDHSTYQWVKVQAEVFRSVSFAFGLASVTPGTRFQLEQQPEIGSLWLPVHFRVTVNASVLWFHRRTVHDEVYSHYQKQSAAG